MVLQQSKSWCPALEKNPESVSDQVIRHLIGRGVYSAPNRFAASIERAALNSPLLPALHFMSVSLLDGRNEAPPRRCARLAAEYA
jgi:hypothetical protein